MPPAAPTDVFTWIGQYGISTVFAVILLVYTLWAQSTTQTKIAKAIEELSTTMGKLSVDLVGLANAQARQSEVLSSTVRALDRIQDRLEHMDKDRPS